MQGLITSLYRNEDGATMLEYALMVSLIAVACITAVNYLQGSLSNSFNHSANLL
jgi:pilus assembly protein Flp/PilA